MNYKKLDKDADLIPRLQLCIGQSELKRRSRNEKIPFALPVTFKHVLWDWFITFFVILFSKNHKILFRIDINMFPSF